MTSRPRASVCAGAAAALTIGLLSTDARAWRVNFARVGPAAVDAVGDVFVARSLPAAPHETKVGLVKLAAANGRRLWLRAFTVPGREHSDEIVAVQTAAGGDVLTAANIDVSGRTTFDVARLDGRTGRFRWRRRIVGLSDQYYGDLPAGLALDPAGDVVVAGSLAAASAPQYHSWEDFAVVKLNGATGEVRWRYQHDGAAHDADRADAMVVDGAGDVIALGAIDDDPQTFLDPPKAVKLSGIDGHEIWRVAVDTIDVRGASVDAAGDVLLASTGRSPTAVNAFGVTKISGHTGETLWSRTISAADGTWQSAFQVRALPSGDVAAVGFVGDLDHESKMLVAVFDGTSGAERWRWTADGTQHHGFGRSLRIDGTTLLVSGQVRNDGTCYDILLARLDGISGAVLGSLLLDGTTVATQCEPDPCYGVRGRIPCGNLPGHGTDQDDAIDFLLDPRGRPVVLGTLSDRTPAGHDRTHAMVRTFPNAAAIGP